MEQNLANLYRPAKFADVVGQPTAVETLRRIACADGIAARAVFLRGAYGSGKCIAGHQRISTERGYRRICELGNPLWEEGFTDMTLGVEQPDGSIAFTSHFYKESKRILYSLRGSSGCVYTGTSNHPIMAYRLGSGCVELKRVGDLRVGDYVARRWCPSVVGSLSLEGLSASDIAAWLKLGMYVCGHDSAEGFLGDLSARGWVVPDVSLCFPEEVFSHRIYAFLVLCGMASAIGSLTNSGRLLLGFDSDEVVSGLCECLDWLGLQYEVLQKYDNSGNRYVSKRHVAGRAALFVLLDRQSTGVVCAKVGEFSEVFSAVQTYNDGVWAAYREWVGDSDRRPRMHYCGGFDLGSDCDPIVDILRSACSSLPAGVRSGREGRFVRMVACSTSTQRRLSSESLTMVRDILACYQVMLPAEVQGFCDVRLDRIDCITSECTTVYDVSVPSTHLFMSCGVVNHNTTLSRIMGKAMNCERLRVDGDVCNECAGCQEGSSAVSNTYWELDGTVVGNVEGIRVLRDRLQLVPDGRRVVVLDEIQASSSSSMNALLKLVEEGVPNTMFIFSGTEDILPTLRSRCVNIDIGTIPLGVIEDYIGGVAKSRGLSIAGSELSILAAKSQGHMRDALQLLQYYELIGSAALDTSYFKLRDFIASCFSKSGRHDPLELLLGVLSYPIVDIKYSIGLFLRTVFSTMDESSLEFKFRKGKLGDMLFKFFFNPQAQSALQSELGVEILLRSLVEKTAGVRSNE